MAPRFWNSLRDRLAERPPAQRRAILLALPLAFAVLLGTVGGLAFGALIHMPRVESLADFRPGLITEIHDRHGERFAGYSRERRFLIAEDELPPLVAQAVLASEDPNFFEHSGVDPEGVLRAVVKNFVQKRTGARRIGGSTITQQLARRLFLNPAKTWRRKIEEALLAVELEKNFSKPQLLTLYCNLMFLGNGNYGMEAAARSYFHKTVAELTVAEAATLAGILQRPTAYSPYRRPDLVLGRRDYVLRRMLEDGYITREEHDAAVATPLAVAPRTREEQLGPYFAEETRRYLESQYGSEALLEAGLRVDTTLDPAIQVAAERGLRFGLERLDRRRGWRGAPRRVEAEDLEAHELGSWALVDPSPEAWHEGLVLSAGSTARVKIGAEVHELTAKGFEWTRRSRASDLLEPGDVAWFRLQPAAGRDRPPTLWLEQEPEVEGAVVVLESATGAIRAMAGGWSFERSKFNRVTQARRQVGSAFKPFVVGAAIEAGFTPADTFFDSPTVFLGADNRPSYSPRNFYPRYYGITTLRRALELSVNVTSVKLLDMVGVDRVVDFARRCGISSPLPPYPSLALGAAALKPLELAAAFAAIANHGVYVEPYFVERIESPDGTVLEAHAPRAVKSMEPGTAFLLTHMLAGVIDRGTGKAVADLPLDLAAKTGTTDDFTDAWFVGFSPRYTVLAWVGYDQNRRLGRNMTGAQAALPIWRKLFEAGLEEGWLERDERFTPPPEIAFVEIEYLSGLLAAPGAATVIEEAFVRGTEPALQYDPRWAKILALPWYQQRPFYLPKAGEKMPDDISDWEIVRAAWRGDQPRKAPSTGGR